MNTNDLRIMRVEDDNGREVLRVYTPYNEKFVSRIRMISGRYWNREEKCWEVPTQNIDLVRTIMKECYGYTDETSEDEKVTVTIEFTEEYKRDAHEQLIIFGKSIGRVRGRDTGAVLSPDVTLLYGDVNSGGSRNHPCMEIKKGTVLRLDSVSENVLEMDAPSFIRIVDVDGIQVEEPEKDEEDAVDVYTESFESNNEVNKDVTDDNTTETNVNEDATDDNNTTTETINDVHEKEEKIMNNTQEVKVNEEDFKRVAKNIQGLIDSPIDCFYEVCYVPETGEIYTGDLLIGNSSSKFHEENYIKFKVNVLYSKTTAEDLKTFVRELMKKVDPCNPSDEDDMNIDLTMEEVLPYLSEDELAALEDEDHLVIQSEPKYIKGSFGSFILKPAPMYVNRIGDVKGEVFYFEDGDVSPMWVEDTESEKQYVDVFYKFEGRNHTWRWGKGLYLNKGDLESRALRELCETLVGEYILTEKQYKDEDTN